MRSSGGKVPVSGRSGTLSAGADAGSRAHLGLDTLDLVQLHCPPTPVYSRNAVSDALDELVAEQRVAAYGVPTPPPPTSRPTTTAPSTATAGRPTSAKPSPGCRSRSASPRWIGCARWCPTVPRWRSSRWIVDQPQVTVVIPGARSAERARETPPQRRCPRSALTCTPRSVRCTTNRWHRTCTGAGSRYRSAVAASRYCANLRRAASARVGMCSVGTSTGVYPRMIRRATAALCTSSGPS